MAVTNTYVVTDEADLMARIRRLETDSPTEPHLAYNPQSRKAQHSTEYMRNWMDMAEFKKRSGRSRSGILRNLVSRRQDPLLTPRALLYEMRFALIALHFGFANEYAAHINKDFDAAMDEVIDEGTTGEEMDLLVLFISTLADAKRGILRDERFTELDRLFGWYRFRLWLEARSNFTPKRARENHNEPY